MFEILKKYTKHFLSTEPVVPALILLLALVFSNTLVAQPPPPVGCTVTGTNPATASCTYTYTLNGGCSASSWSVSCGSVQSSTSTTCTVYFNVMTCSSSIVKALNGTGGTLASLTVTLNAPPDLSGGTITTNVTQTINYNTTPGLISASAATGGGCGSLVYQWYSSTDGTNYSSISGATGQNYQPPVLTTTTYYKRWCGINGLTDWTTNVATVTVYPQLIGGSIGASTQTINYNTTPSGLTLSGVSGGNGSYTFQWQSFPDNTFTNPTNVGTNSTSYQPPALTSTTYYRVIILSNGAEAYSSTAVVNVYPQLHGGSISQASQTINYNTVPSPLSVGGYSGGNGSYTFQWYSSPDNSTWTAMSGQTGTGYSPPALTSTTYYRVTVNSNGAIANSASAVVNVYPQLQPGSVSPSPVTVNYGRSPGQLSLFNVSGGNSSYTYQWQSSVDNVNWINVGATSATYTPGPLTYSIYYRAIVTSNGVSANSTPSTITVNPQLAPGTVAPGAITITSGTSPGLLTANPANGGACGGSYSYQWMQSTDGVNFTSIGGATRQNYTPGNLSARTWFERQVTCGSDVELTNASVVNIGSLSVNSNNLNFVRVRDITKPNVTDTATADSLTIISDVLQTTQYLDGLGRNMQTVTKQISPLGNDLVTPSVLDGFGRVATSYLPYVSASNDGNYKATFVSDQTSFNGAQFTGEQFYYGQTDFEPSPLNRTLNTYSPGTSWIGSSRFVSNRTMVNTANDSVQLWSISSVQGSLPINSGGYSPGKLSKIIGTDEQGRKSIEFKDKKGRLILKKIQQSNTPGTAHIGWLCTYYVYDTLQNLRFVIQPQAVTLVNSTWSISQNIANELCFRYEYDQRKRLIIKKLPGAWEQWMVYDARDRLVMSQDSNLRALGKWSVTEYDSLNRPWRTGLLTDGNNRTYHQNLASNSISYPNTSSNYEVLTQAFYDDYTWANTYAPSLGTNLATAYTSNNNYFITNYNTSPTYAVPISAYVNLQPGPRLKQSLPVLILLVNEKTSISWNKRNKSRR